MRGLIYNEIEKILRQTRFAAVLIVYTLLIATVGFIDRGTPAAATYTGASSAFVWVMGGFAGVLIPLSICVLVGDTLAGESSSGTIKLLLIRPVGRWKIWLSKYAAALCASLAAVLYLGVCAYVVLGLLFGFGSWAAHPPSDVKFQGATLWALTWQAYALESLAVAALVGFVLFASTVLRSGVAAVGISAAAVFVGMIVTDLAGSNAWVGLLPFPHFQIADHLIGTFPLGGCSLGRSAAALCLWTALSVAAGLWLFQHRDVTD